MLKTIPELMAEVGPSVRKTTAEEAYKSLRDEPAVFVDVREPAEAAGQPISGSINIPRGVLEMKIRDLCPQADSRIFVHCASGIRASLAVEQLQRLGYTNATAISCAAGTICSMQENHG
ncbi:MAG: rhodanese-like domain-containing protein [Pseudomonadales bacterium]